MFWLVTYLPNTWQLFHFTFRTSNTTKHWNVLSMLLFNINGFNLTTSLAIWHLFVWFLHIFSILCLQVVCAKYGIGVESSSQIDRRALNYLINYYLNISIHGYPPKVVFHFCQSFLLQCQFMPSSMFSDCRKELFSCHEQDTSTEITSCPSSKIGKVLGDFLQVVSYLFRQ
jgi:hypothetical protein